MRATEFELCHGAVLCRLHRAAAGGPGPRLLEARPEEGWSILELDDGSACVVRHRARPRRLRRRGGGLQWSFPFGFEQVRRLRELARRGTLRLALVGATAQRHRFEIALLHPQELERLLDLGSFLPQRMTLTALRNRELRVRRGRVELKVARRRLE